MSRQWVGYDIEDAEDEAQDIAKQVAIAIYAGGVDTVSKHHFSIFRF
jgi:hypothetical protein